MAVHRKVQASTTAAAVAGGVVYLLQRYVIHKTIDPVVSAQIYIAMPAVLAFAAGYLTRGKPVPPSPSGRREYLPSLPGQPGLVFRDSITEEQAADFKAAFAEAMDKAASAPSGKIAPEPVPQTQADERLAPPAT